MTVSPLVRTHMTGLLVFGNHYVAHVYNEESVVLKYLMNQYKKSYTISVKPARIQNNINSNKRKSFRRRTYGFLNTKKTVKNRMKIKNLSKSPIPEGEPIPQQYANSIINTTEQAFGGKSRRLQQKRKLKTKKAKKQIKKRRTYRNKK